MDDKVINYAILVTALVVVLVAYSILFSLSNARETFEADEPAKYMDHTYLLVNPECKHAPTGYVFRSEMLLNNRADMTNESCEINGTLLGLVSDRVTCDIAPNIPGMSWVNPLSKEYCGRNVACSNAVDHSGGVIKSAKTNLSEPSCVLKFNSGVTAEQLQTFESNLFNGVSGFLSASAVMGLKSQVSQQASQIKQQDVNFAEQAYKFNSEISALNSNIGLLEDINRHLNTSNSTLHTFSNNCTKDLKGRAGALKRCDDNLYAMSTSNAFLTSKNEEYSSRLSILTATASVVPGAGRQ